jgi:hypothetical protein
MNTNYIIPRNPDSNPQCRGQKVLGTDESLPVVGGS